MKKLLKPSAKSVLMPLGLTATVLATDAVIHKERLLIRYDKINNL